MQTVEFGACLGLQRIAVEVAGRMEVSTEVHGEEVTHLNFLDKAGCAHGCVLALSGIDGEEGHIKFGVFGGDAVHFGLKKVDGLFDLAWGADVFPVPAVEVACVEYAFAVWKSYGETYAAVGAAKCFYFGYTWEVFDNIAPAHPLYGEVSVGYAADIVADDVLAAVVLAEVEDVGVEVVFMVVADEEQYG